MSQRLTVLVLAGQREGRVDPLAEAKGVRFKALTPVFGRPMILHTLDAVAARPDVDQILVSINDCSGVERLDEVRALIDTGRLKIVTARPNIVDSVLTALDGAAFPVLITTADNVLLTPDAIGEIDGGARRAGSDVAIALARRESVLSAHSEGQRKFYAFADGAYSNCNSYWIGRRSALATAELFRSGGQFVKHPMRVVGALGLAGVFELLRFRFGVGTLEGGCRRLSKRFKLRVSPVVLSDGAVAIDVDAERTLKVAEEVLAARQRATPGAALQAAC